MRHTRSTHSLVPSRTAGHLYYIRLKTNFGPLYKLGFTSMSSVYERFAYKGNGDEKLIDEVYLFAYDREAFYHEVKLHSHFGRKKAFGEFSNRIDFPLYQNGQSELYYSDILGLDSSYTEERGQQTFDAIHLRRASASSRPPWAIQSAIFILAIPIKAISLLFKAGTVVYRMIAKKESAAPMKPIGPSYAERRYDREINALLDWIQANRTAPGRETPCVKELSTRPDRVREAAEHDRPFNTEDWDAFRRAGATNDQRREQSPMITPEVARRRDTDVPTPDAAVSVPMQAIPFTQPARGAFDAVRAQVSGNNRQHVLDGENLVVTLKKAHFQEVASYVALSHALDEELVLKFKNVWNWDSLSSSASVYWSVNLIERFEERWAWRRLSCNETLPWSAKLIAAFAERWDWCALSGNPSIPWTSDLIAAFGEQWDWCALSENTTVPFDEALLQRFGDCWQWDILSENPAIRPTTELIARFHEHWDWRTLPNNSALHISGELIELFEECWDWDQLTASNNITWSVALIDKYTAKLHWRWLSQREDLPWTATLIERFEDRWDWQSLAANEGLPWTTELLGAFFDRWVIEASEYASGGLAGNKACPWKLELIERLQHRLNWKHLSANPALPWSIELIDRYQDRWDWSDLSRNTGLPWSSTLIKRYQEQWDWGGHHSGLSCNESVPWTAGLVNQFRGYLDATWLAANCRVPWSMELIEQFSEELDWHFFSRNEAVPWSMSLIEKYADRLHWGDPGLFSNPGAHLPLLNRSQVIDIMQSSDKRKSESENHINSLIHAINHPTR